MSESDQHAAVVRLINTFPEVVLTVLTMLGTPLPPGARVRFFPTNVSAHKDPRDRRLKAQSLHADNSVGVEVEGEVVLYALPEFQLKPSAEKIFRWLQYFTQTVESVNGGRLALRRPVRAVAILAISPNQYTISWSEKTYDKLARTHKTYGQGIAFRPLFVGPKQLPEITDLAVAQKDLPLAALTAAVHPKSLQAAMLAVKAARRSPKRHIIFAVLFHCCPLHVQELNAMSTEFNEFAGTWADLKLDQLRAQVQAERAQMHAQARAEAQALKSELVAVVMLQLDVRFPQESRDTSFLRLLQKNAGVKELLQVLKVLLRSTSPTWQQVLGALEPKKARQRAPKPLSKQPPRRTKESRARLGSSKRVQQARLRAGREKRKSVKSC